METPINLPTGLAGFLLWLVGALLSGGGLGLWAGRRKQSAEASSVNAETAIKLITAIENNYAILNTRYLEEVKKNEKLEAENEKLEAENHRVNAMLADYDDIRKRLKQYEDLDLRPTLHEQRDE